MHDARAQKRRRDRGANWANMKVAGPDHGPDVVMPLVVTSCSPTACCNTYWGDTSRLGGGVAPLAPERASSSMEVTT